LTSEDLFGELFVPEAIRDATSGRAWVAAMLAFEAALAGAEAEAGVIPAEAAAAIAAACDADRFDPGEIGRAGRETANPAAALVSALTDAVEGDAAGYVHWGATSQDASDSAAMLVARGGLALIDAELEAVAAACAKLAEQHRQTPMVARTLLQQALPTTFGLKAAGWLVAVVEAQRRLAGIQLPAELGGAAGTLAALGTEGPRVLSLLSERLGLSEPVIPWHTARGTVAELGAALALAAGALEKIALDVKLLSQTEVGEVAEGGAGGSSTLPQKRNPTGSALAIACSRQVRGEASVLLAAMAQEQERAAGAGQAEWPALSGALAHCGGAAAAIHGVVEGLEVDEARMLENLEAGGGLVMTESVSMALAPALGRGQAKRLVGEAAGRALDGDRPLRDELLGDSAISAQLSAQQLDAALEPSSYLGSAPELVDRALAAYRGEA
jgi:3-carboxy-cis,cis-muconate cycloisomerase